MSTQVDDLTIEVELFHPDGQIRLQAPTDVPLGELMDEFLDVCEQPAGEDWALSGDGRTAYPVDRSLGELEVGDGARLVLVSRPDPSQPPSGPAEIMSAAAQLAAPPLGPVTRDRLLPAAPNAASNPAAASKPLTAKTTAVLPARLSGTGRIREALCALRARPDRPRPLDSDIPDPTLFMRRTRASPQARLRAAWLDTEYQYRLERRIGSQRLRRCATIAVLSPKGGVGKTTITVLVGSMLAYLRRDRVVAVDTNSDWGSLGRKLVPEHRVFIDDLLAGPLADGLLSPTQLDAQMGRGPDGLMIAPAPTDQSRAARLDEASYGVLFTRLQELVGTLVLDCGTGLKSAPAQAALRCADQLVLVCDDEPDSASLVTEAAGGELAALTIPVVLVVNGIRRSSRIDVSALEREMPSAGGIVTIPHDEEAAASLQGSRLSWRRSPAAWQTPVSELVALLVSDWRRLGVAH